MTTIEISIANGVQSLNLPPEFHINGDRAAIRREGDAVILEPVKANKWPNGFFDAIYIDDPAFARPDQGQMPPAPTFDYVSGVAVLFLLDTNTCIAAVRKHSSVISRMASLTPGDCAISTITSY